MEFEMVDQETAGKTIIKVVGVGGAGGNAVQHMIRRNVNGVEVICMNTDAGAAAFASEFKSATGGDWLRRRCEARSGRGIC